jgi:Caudovirus prohead serine protease
MSFVMTDQEARAKRPHLYDGSLVVRDFAFVQTTPESRSSTTLVDEVPAVLETITAYVLRWDTPVLATRRDGYGKAVVERNAYARGALDDWLAEHDAGEVEMCHNHEGALIGRWTEFQADAFGLMGTAQLFDTTAGRAALQEALSSGEPAMSCRTRFGNDEATVEEDEVGCYRLVHRMSLEEAGPVDHPADPGARMLYVGNRWVGEDFDPERIVLEALPVDELAAEIRTFVGDEFAERLDEARFAAARQREHDEDQAARLTRCVLAIRTARQDAERKWSYYKDRLGSLDEYRAAEVECDEHEAWLEEQVSTVDFRALTAGLPPRIPLHARMMTDVRRRALPVGRW